MSPGAPLTSGLPPERPLLAITSAEHTTASVLHCRGEIDLSTIAQLETLITEVIAVQAPECRAVVVDLSEISFLAAAGLTVLVTAHQRCGDDLELRIVAATRPVLQPLHLTGLDEQLPIYPSLTAALDP